MEFPVIVPDSGDQNTRYTIKAKDLSYKLCRQNSYLNWASCLTGENKDRSGSSKYIIKNLNCEAKPGEITALTGLSGAGKTTLLEILAGVNLPQGETSGHVLINNKPMNSKSFLRKALGYVSQDEALFPLLTVEETLMYSARLRMQGGDLNRPAARVHELQGDDLNHPAARVHWLQCGDLNRPAARVRVLLKELGLEHVANVRIGDESSRGISGGEKRRVSIGVELVHDPAVLLLDEPTSGLDSASALHLALLLKSMAVNQGKTIVITIHQPGFRILELFDQVILLFNGTIRHHGSLQKLEERLKIAGHEIPARVNVLEFAIDVAGSMHIDTKENDISLVEEQQFEFFEQNDFSYPNSHIGEIVILSQRFSKNIFRTKQLFAARIIQAILAGFVLGTIFMNAMNAPNKKFKLQTQIGFFAFSLTFLLSSTTEGLPIFLQERRILMRETSRGAYRISSYVLSNTIIFLPFLLLVTLLFATPVYWLVGLRKDYDGFLYFSLVVWMTILMSNSLVASFSALVPNFIMGTSLIAGINGSFFLFSGYFISKDDIPWYWIFMHYLSLFKYPFECFLINEFGGENGKDRCLQSVGEECLLNGDMFLRQQGLMEPQKWINLWVMFGFIFGYRFICFLILWYRSCRIRV